VGIVGSFVVVVPAARRRRRRLRIAEIDDDHNGAGF
jgi:hypothetical protein